MEQLAHNRDWSKFGITPDWLKEELEKVLPGVWQWIATNFNPTKTTPWALLKNRVYKMYYSGTSDRGKRHDPNTRATVSGEHWTKKVGEGSDLFALAENIDLGKATTVLLWEDYLRSEPTQQKIQPRVRPGTRSPQP